MAENTLQFEWITTLKWGCETLFADRKDVFVAGDHLIYPVEPKENPETNQYDLDEVVRFAPDVYVVFGRPKVHRGSYKVWEEEGIFPQVVFEVWLPGNRTKQMEDKRHNYEKYGAEEYYIVYPETPAVVEGWLRDGTELTQIEEIEKWTSPRLGIRFEIQHGVLTVMRPDGTKFLTYLELSQKVATEEQHAREEAKRADQEAERASHEAERANHEAERANHEAERASQEAERANHEAERAEEAAKRAKQETIRAEAAERHAAKLAAKLRELGLDPDAS